MTSAPEGTAEEGIHGIPGKLSPPPDSDDHRPGPAVLTFPASR
ncbi:hypothetical protein [Streptomyces lanatus]|uniref:Uncharacterized protein n=1 Tax=Streptomyces lanatus TaxID=66900 RepID=A0ABV1XNH5_9ACTN|nr:hypothetical protein [Streptomyces lanatus]